MDGRWWRFYMENYFPYMYGLMMIENHCKKTKQVSKISTMKRQFIEETIQYLEKKKIFYIKSELEEILKLNMNEEFRRVLLKEYHEWPREKMEDVLEIVNQILEA